MGRFSPNLYMARTIRSAQFATVADNTIYLQFVDSDGNRARLPGRVGQTLLQVAELHKVDLVGPCGGGGKCDYMSVGVCDIGRDIMQRLCSRPAPGPL